MTSLKCSSRPFNNYLRMHPENLNNKFEMSKVSKSGLVAINLTGFQRLSVYRKWSDFRIKRLNVSSYIYWRVVHFTQTLLGRLYFAFVLIVNRRACTQTVVAVLISFALKSLFSQFKRKYKGFLVTQVKAMWKILIIHSLISNDEFRYVEWKICTCRLIGTHSASLVHDSWVFNDSCD